MADTQRESRAELTRVASERVTWEAAAELVHTHAVDAFRRHHDDTAQLLRGITDALQERARDASIRQDALLRKLGMR